MNPEPVTLDEATAAILAGANGHAIPLCKPDGTLIGYGVSPISFAKMQEAYDDRIAELDRNWPPEEIERIIAAAKADTSPRIPHEEVMRWIESL